MKKLIAALCLVPVTSFLTKADTFNTGLIINTGAVPLQFHETDTSGAGSLWRVPLDANTLRFDVSQDGDTFSPYITPLSMKSDGKVGIGTITPLAALSVEKPWGSGSSSDMAAFFGGKSANSGRYNTYITGHTLAVAYGNNTDDAGMWINWQGYLGGHARFRDFYLGNGKGESVFMSDGSTGNIGIGTNTPDHRLDVRGTIRAEEVIVETGWSDFVFEADYVLRPLGEVEAHIEEYGHLPDVPSAKVVESEGLSVGESQKIMMQKIEELTLYMIEQEKRISTLELENQTLRSSIRDLD